jgi:membrane-associated phospholipid phosphatase
MEGARSGLPLLAASARPRAGVLLAGCAVLVAVLGAVFARQDTADRFDHAVDAPVITWFAGHHTLALWLAFPGTTIPAVVLTAALALGCLFTGRRRGAVLAILAVPVTAAITDGLAATATVLLLAPPRSAMARPLRVLILAVAYLACVAVVVGVIAVRFHYFTDTVAGAAVGIGTVCGLALVLDLIPAVWP